MTRLYVKWSTQGKYLVTMHNQGIQIWGGPEWSSFHKLKHNQVQYIDFSPCDQFMVTCNAQQRQSGGGEAQARRDAMTVKFILHFAFLLPNKTHKKQIQNPTK